jgi:GTP-binding protein YchF
MKLGIIGMPQSGKTTIFNALTGGNRPTNMSGGRIEVTTAVVDVPDPRLDKMVEIYHPKKVSPAKVTYADIAGMDGSSSSTGISGELLNNLQKMDGFLLVVRCFEDENVPHPKGTVNAQRDIDSMLSELWINDLIAVERKLEKLQQDRKKGGRDIARIEKEQGIFQKLHDHLSEEKHLKTLDTLAKEDWKDLTGYAFLTLKPVLVVLNCGEGQAAPEVTAPDCDVVSLQGKLEMDIAQLGGEEAEMFLAEYGIEEPSLNKMIRLSYDLMGLQSFFTVGEDDCHAWTVERGAKAPAAAGVIHSDLEKGFIRAEILSYDDHIKYGTFAKAREAGVLRIEGKEYVVQDGEIMHVRFNV